MLDGISDNMVSLSQLGKYGAIIASDTTTMGNYVINYPYLPYTLHEDQTTDDQLSKAGELIVKAEYLSLMKAKKRYLQQHGKTRVL